MTTNSLKYYNGLLRAISIALSVLLILSSCVLTRHVPEGEYLLDRNVVRIDNKSINNRELQNSIRQKANKRILMFSRPYLWIFNLSNPIKFNKFQNKIREFGEPPVILDLLLVEKSKEQLTLFLKNKGYYNSQITDTIVYKDRRAKIFYEIKTGNPYVINKINYQIDEKDLETIIVQDSTNSLIKVGDPFNLDILQNQRKQIESTIRNSGYFEFSKEMIMYEADTTPGNLKVNLSITLIPLTNKDSSKFVFKQTLINQVSVYCDFDLYIQNKDTTKLTEITFFEGFKYYYPNGRTLKASILNNNIFLIPGQLYKLSEEDVTYKNLASLKLFKYINIRFEKSTKPDSSGFQYIDCHIELANNIIQDIETNVDLTSSTGLGVSGSITYNHRNLFKGAESFNLKIGGAYEAIKKTDETKFDKTIEMGIEAGLTMHRFFIPIKFDRFIIKYNPKTFINTSYTFKQRPEYKHTIANASLGYSWKSNTNVSIRFSPFDLNFVDLIEPTTHFLSLLDRYQRSSFIDHILAGGNFMYEFNNQLLKKNTAFTFIRYNIEFYGNSLFGIYKTFNIQPNNLYYKIFDINFAQFIRNDFEIRYNQPINELDRVAFRFFAGLAVPYGNSRTIPFERQFFGGGPNSMRAWQYRNIGPGGYHDNTLASFANRTADLKIEFNIEYRFKLFLNFEGALFTDMGNIWSIHKYDPRKDASFSLDRFYKEFGVGSGLGLRYDFNFAILRTDLAMKLFNPGNLIGDRWFTEDPITWKDDMNLSFGIGFPF